MDTADPSQEMYCTKVQEDHENVLSKDLAWGTEGLRDEAAALPNSVSGIEVCRTWALNVKFVLSASGLVKVPFPLIICAAECEEGWQNSEVQRHATMVCAGEAQPPPCPMTRKWHHFQKWHHFWVTSECDHSSHIQIDSEGCRCLARPFWASEQLLKPPKDLSKTSVFHKTGSTFLRPSRGLPHMPTLALRTTPDMTRVGQPESCVALGQVSHCLTCL